MVKTINLRGINYLGSVRDKKGFCQFGNVTYEFRAFTLNLLAKLQRFGIDFPRMYIDSYAPASDGNDPGRYFDICAPLLDAVNFYYHKCVDGHESDPDNNLIGDLCNFYASAISLYRCQQIVESGYTCPQFSEPIDFTLAGKVGKEFIEPFPGLFGHFWQFCSNFTNLMSWIYYSHYTLSNKWLMVYLYSAESSSKPSFKSQLDLFQNDLRKIIEQLHLEVVSDDDMYTLSRYYGEQVRKFPISQSPYTVKDYELNYQEHPSSARVVTLHISDHSDPDEIFPFPREAARP